VACALYKQYLHLLFFASVAKRPLIASVGPCCIELVNIAARQVSSREAWGRVPSGTGDTMQVMRKINW